jgi:hypothetical protein
MSKIKTSFNIDIDLLNEIKELAENEKAYSRKLEEIIRIGVHYYNQGARLELAVVNKSDLKQSTDKSNKKPNDPFLA